MAMPAILSELGTLKSKLTATDSLNALAGNPNTAKLTIEDRRAQKTEEPVNPAASGAAAGASALTQAVLESASEALAGGAPSAASAASSPTTRIFSVQFNPSSFDIYATSLDVQKLNTVRDEDGSQRAFTDSAVAPTVEMSVELVFDHVTIADAFMVDKLRQGVFNTGINAIASLSGKKPVYTVRTEVEGLIGALRNSHTRTVTFTWADFSFKGTLKDVAAEYTMFSLEGRPIRAKVMLRIRQEQSDESRAAWKSDFVTAFSPAGATSLADKVRSATNLINIGL